MKLTDLGNGLYLKENGKYQWIAPFPHSKVKYEIYKVEPKYDFETGYKWRKYIEGKDGYFNLVRDTGDR